MQCFVVCVLILRYSYFVAFYIYFDIDIIGIYQTISVVKDATFSAFISDKVLLSIWLGIYCRIVLSLALQYVAMVELHFINNMARCHDGVLVPFQHDYSSMT